MCTLNYFPYHLNRLSKWCPVNRGIRNLDDRKRDVQGQVMHFQVMHAFCYVYSVCSEAVYVAIVV